MHNATGVGETSVDFAFDDWHVELLSFDETDAAKAATWENGPFFSRMLMSPKRPTADEATLDEAERQRRSGLRKQSPEGETLKAIEKIVGKAQNDGRPSKFPIPNGTSRSMLIVDARAHGSPDRIDCRQIAYGASAVPEWAGCRWIGDDGREFPIIGAFEARNSLREPDTSASGSISSALSPKRPSSARSCNTSSVSTTIRGYSPRKTMRSRC